MTLDNPYAVTLSNPRRKKSRSRRRHVSRRRHAPVVAISRTKKIRRRKNPMKTSASSIKSNITHMISPALGFFAGNFISNMVDEKLVKNYLGKSVTDAAAAAAGVKTSSMTSRFASRLAVLFAARALSRNLPHGRDLAEGAALNLVITAVKDISTLLPTDAQKYFSIGETMPDVSGFSPVGDDEGDIQALIGDDEEGDVINGLPDVSGFSPVGDDDDIEGFNPIEG